MKHLPRILKLSIILGLIACPEFAYSQTELTIPEITVLNCEENSARLDVLAVELLSNEERAFVIARLGRGEVSRELSRRRLSNVRTYLEARRIEPGRLIFAEGERAEGQGRVEVYVGSKLKFGSLIKRGKDMCVTCCSPDPAYYGQGKKDVPKRKSR